MGSVHAKPSSTTSRSYSKRQSSSLVAVIRGVMLALAASALPFLIIYTLPSLKLFLFDVLPSLWRCSCELFTPRNLFVLLNLIILTIFAMAHLHSSQAVAASSSLQSPACDDSPHATSEDAVSRSVSEEINLDDHNSADLQLVDDVESTDEQISDLHDQPTNHDVHNDDDRHNQALITGVLVIKEVITETHLQQADDHGKIEKRKADPKSKKAEKAKIRQEGVTHCADRVEKLAAQAESKKAEKARIRQEGVADEAIVEKLAAQAKSKKAEKATSMSSLQGNPLADKSYNIDSLLSEEGSIFTQVQSRPLPSARFTHKKAAKLSGLDRPLSPLKMSRPILKRGDTLEATWKAICESKRHSSPLNRHYSRHSRKVLDNSEEIIEGIVMSSNELSKANSLKRRESSLPKEELNAKVESFISRFNEKIRIQREKSLLDHYMEMVGRGAS